MIDSNKQLSKVAKSDLAKLLEASKQKLNQTEFNRISIQETLNDLLIETESKPAILFGIIRLAVSWSPFSPALNETLEILGKEKTISRLESAIEAL